jgi:hypothetical protein
MTQVVRCENAMGISVNRVIIVLMRSNIFSLLAVCFFSIATISASDFELLSPLDYQVIQRATAAAGVIPISIRHPADLPPHSLLQARIIVDSNPGPWQVLTVARTDDVLRTKLDSKSGGWFQLELRVTVDEKIVWEGSVAHVGIGEVFVVAGQSNSANHGEERLKTKTNMVSAFDGHHWQIANDPQPGASGQGGSFMPPFGDAMAKQLNVPIGILACGIGATSVREWLPEGDTFPNPPTIEDRVIRLPNGNWQSKGEAFANLIALLHSQGPGGVRAVLWHQGESDANQRDPSRTLEGTRYRACLIRLIEASRKEIAWEVPWFVAQVSYHVPGDEASPDIREAQASLWHDGIALEGPDSDSLKGDLRENNGQGVHFSSQGLKAHGEEWAKKVAPWLTSELAKEKTM